MSLEGWPVHHAHPIPTPGSGHPGLTPGGRGAAEGPVVTTAAQGRWPLCAGVEGPGAAGGSLGPCAPACPPGLGPAVLHPQLRRVRGLCAPPTGPRGSRAALTGRLAWERLWEAAGHRGLCVGQGPPAGRHKVGAKLVSASVALRACPRRANLQGSPSVPPLAPPMLDGTLWDGRVPALSGLMGVHGCACECCVYGKGCGHGWPRGSAWPAQPQVLDHPIRAPRPPQRTAAQTHSRVGKLRHWGV